MRHERNFESTSLTNLDLATLLPPVKRQMIKPEIRFQKMLERKPNGCLIFTGAVDPSSLGYGRFREAENRVWIAHRYAWFLRYGTVPALLRHVKCHNPLCCETDHIQPGTHQDNTDDMMKAGRQRGKLLPEQVELIVALHTDRGMSADDLAERFKVSSLAVRKLLDGRTWSKLTGIQYRPKRQKKLQLKEVA